MLLNPNLVLRDYQKEDIKKMVNWRKAINGNPPGLGKTLETIMASYYLKAKRILVICPRFSFHVWQREYMLWLNTPSFVYTGTKKQRKAMWDAMFMMDELVIIATSKMIKEITTIMPEFDVVIADEYHMWGGMNHKTSAFKDLVKVKAKAKYMLTGTPIRKDPTNLYAPLNLINPVAFKSYYSFINRYCMVFEGDYGQPLIGAVPKNPDTFRKMLYNGYLIRHKKHEVLKELPRKQRDYVISEMSKNQERYYKEMKDDKTILTDEGGLILAQNHLVRDLRLRQLLISPRILGIDEDGGAIPLVSKLISDEFINGNDVVICTPFKKAIPFITEYLKHDLAEYSPNICVVTGDTKDVGKVVDKDYQQSKSKHNILIYTIKAGASFTAHRASVAFFLGYEWSASDNIQAEDRIHRIGQKATSVRFYYVLHRETVDEAVMAVISRKNYSEEYTLNEDIRDSYYKKL